jgi:hypothetical protein
MPNLRKKDVPKLKKVLSLFDLITIFDKSKKGRLGAIPPALSKPVKNEVVFGLPASTSVLRTMYKRNL